jgi:hypothetical protein
LGIGKVRKSADIHSFMERVVKVNGTKRPKDLLSCQEALVLEKINAHLDRQWEKER